ncbi:iron chelate uptake ABC transporter family permease subunit [Marinomonas dokdonensis]|uniref:iron chelate uptake ABC transporter family permease subunit n=1 Tax=Marinomonas dokdonensis TaxID=328224 RepID=UPI0040557A4A
MKISLPTYLAYCLTFSLLLLAIILVSLFVWSSFPLSIKDAIGALTAFQDDSIAQQIIYDIRLPRSLIAATVGACLAAAGVIMQGLTQNPLASPSVLGVNAGAALGMAAVSTIAPWFGLLGTSIAAMLGGGIAWCLVMMMANAWRLGNENGRLVLAGVAISALCAALTKALVIMEEDQASAVLTWLAGSFANGSWERWSMFWPVALLGLLASQLLTPKLNLLQLGEENATNLGLSLLGVKLGGSLLVLLLVGSAISVSGSIGFVGLLVPHMARVICGQDHRRFLPIAMLLGAVLVVLADTLSRAIVFPLETPAGAILALVGAPFFLYLVNKRTR